MNKKYGGIVNFFLVFDINYAFHENIFNCCIVACVCVSIQFTMSFFLFLLGLWNNDISLQGNHKMHYYGRWNLDVYMQSGNNRLIERILCKTRSKSGKTALKSPKNWEHSSQFSTIITVRCEFFPPGQIVNKEYYLHVM